MTAARSVMAPISHRFIALVTCVASMRCTTTWGGPKALRRRLPSGGCCLDDVEELLQRACRLLGL